MRNKVVRLVTRNNPMGRSPIYLLALLPYFLNMLTKNKCMLIFGFEGKNERFSAVYFLKIDEKFRYA